MEDHTNLPQGQSRALARVGLDAAHVPAIVAAAGEDAARHFPNFFIASIRNRNTRRSYVVKARLFLSWCEQHGLRDVRDIRTEHGTAGALSLSACASAG